jgi:ribose-phosphate pyrophosphokinase
MNLVLLSGNANLPLAAKISQYLDISMGKAFVGNFSDGETRVELQTNVRGRDVFIVQSTSAPVNHHIMELLAIVDACKRASASQITVVTPYFGYARQERKSASRTPITAKLIADLFQAAGIHRLVALELHNAAIQGFFNVPVDHLYINPVLAAHLEKEAQEYLVVSPDAGGVERARSLAKHFGWGLAIIDKRRDKPNDSNVMHVIGHVEGKRCLIIDDIVDTGGSLVKAAEALHAKGALSVSAAITHPVLSGNAVERIQHSCLDRLVVADSIPLSLEAQQCDKIVQITVGELLAKAILRIHTHDSISSLFG